MRSKFQAVGQGDCRRMEDMIMGIQLGKVYHLLLKILTIKMRIGTRYRLSIEIAIAKTIP